MWEEEVNVGNDESARFDVYYMTFGVAWQQLRLHAKRMPLGSNVFMVLDRNKDFKSSAVAQPGRKVQRG